MNRLKAGGALEAPRHQSCVMFTHICLLEIGLPWRAKLACSRSILALILPDEDVGLVSFGGRDEWLRRLIPDWSTTIRTTLRRYQLREVSNFSH